MNIFVLDDDHQKCAQYHCDKHVVKMILEYAQILSTNVRIANDCELGYKITHRNHPCTIWARKSLSNWLWLKKLSYHLNEEYKYRYGHIRNHKSYDVIETLPTPNIPDVGLTPFAQAMPDYCKADDAVDAYRRYYILEKKDIVNWKKRNLPNWYK
jgi:hypothetical protein